MSGNDTHAETIREALPLLSRFEHQPLCQSFFDNGGTPLPCNCIVAKTEDAIAALHALVAQLERERARADQAEAALREIERFCDTHQPFASGKSEVISRRVRDRARAALSAGSTETP